MAGASSFQRLLTHAQQLLTLGGADEILTASCREVLARAGVARGFASSALPRQSWEQGPHLEVEAASARPASPAARSALFALHRRAVAAADVIEVRRGPETAAIFAGLGCGEDTGALTVLPIIHRTGRVWGELVLIGGPPDGERAAGLTDIAQLATMALENAQRLAFARRDQDRLLLLAEATDDALYDWDLETRGFWWGGGILRLLGSDAEPVEHTPCWKHDRVHPEDLEDVLASLERARSSNAMRWEVQYRFRRHDGTYLHIEDRAYFLRDVDGRAYRVIGSMRDVTAMKQLLLREHAARTEAERASRAKDEFLAMLGHELRNPLAPIVSGLELLRVRGGIDLQQDLPVLQRQAQHLIRLVDDLLDISRIAHGKIELQRERLEVAGVIAAAVETARPLIEGRRHALAVHAPWGLVLHADRARLAQAIANLLTNAAKYTEPGGRIEIAAERAGDEIAITVRDSGIGIEPEMLPHIFQMFVQERQALDRAQGGLGLGLAIVHNLVALHGGTTRARSEGHGRGSELEIRLPAAPDAIAEAPREAAPAAPPPRGRRIMIVDDNEDAADLLSTLLEQHGNTTRVAHDARDALRLAEEFAPDLAVLDIGLPEIDGYELARRLRDRFGHRALSLIALTGYGQASDRERAASAGFDAHLVKPVAVGTLQALIATLAPEPAPPGQGGEPATGGPAG